MEKWTEIRRRVLVDRQSKRSVCRELNIRWDTLTKILGHTEPPGTRRLVDGEEGVVELAVTDATTIQLAGQPVMAVDVNLDHEGEPGGDADVHGAELAVQEVEIEAQAFAAGGDQGWSAHPGNDLETAAGSPEPAPLCARAR